MGHFTTPTRRNTAYGFTDYTPLTHSRIGLTIVRPCHTSVTLTWPCTARVHEACSAYQRWPGRRVSSCTHINPANRVKLRHRIATRCFMESMLSVGSTTGGQERARAPATDRAARRCALRRALLRVPTATRRTTHASMQKLCACLALPTHRPSAMC